MTQPRRMLKRSYFLENGTIITPLLLLYLELGLVCQKFYRFVQYIPMKCFKNFVQSAVKARRERKRNENPNSSVIAETMKLLANSSYGYQFTDRSRHTIRKYPSDKKTHGANNNEMFKRLGYRNGQLYEVELVKSDVEHKEPKNIGIFLLQFATWRKLELYHSFVDKYSDVTKFKELEMETDSLYLA